MPLPAAKDEAPVMAHREVGEPAWMPAAEAALATMRATPKEELAAELKASIAKVREREAPKVMEQELQAATR